MRGWGEGRKGGDGDEGKGNRGKRDEVKEKRMGGKGVDGDEGKRKREMMGKRRTGRRWR
jgi:hypothetical protein